MRKIGLLLLFASSLTLSFGETSAADICDELQSRLVALEAADREQWEGRGSAADPYAIERQRTAVLKAMAANRCRGSEAQRKKRPNRIFAGLFGNKRPFRSGGFREGGLFGDRALGNSLTSGSYRTLCVRACDGYYFPISFSASGGELQRDENACRALCPGQEVALYVQRNPGADGGPMVSLDGEPYSALPAAFHYRRAYDRACTCGPVDAQVAAAFQAYAMPPPNRAPAHPGAESSGETVPQPLARIREDDPDTVANRIGAFAVRAIAREPAGTTVYREGPDGKVVRLVGPEASFLAE